MIEHLAYIHCSRNMVKSPVKKNKAPDERKTSSQGLGKQVVQDPWLGRTLWVFRFRRCFRWRRWQRARVFKPFLPGFGSFVLLTQRSVDGTLVDTDLRVAPAEF